MMKELLIKRTGQRLVSCSRVIFMKLLVFSNILALGLVSCSSLYDFGKVHPLAVPNIAEVLKDFPVSMVKFYTPTCGHCINLKPHYEDAAKQLKDRKVPMFEINCLDHPDVCNAHQIRGYPTLKSFFKDQPYEEFDSHDPAMIIDYLTRLTMDPVQKLSKLEELKQMINENGDVKFLGLFKDDNSVEYKLFHEFAHKNRSKALFLSTNLPEAFKEMEVTQESAVVCLKNFDEPKTLMKDQITADSLGKFVFLELLPILGSIHENNFTQYINANLPILFIFYVKEEDRVSLTKDLTHVAQKYRGRYSFALIDGFKYDGHAESLGLKTDSFPAVAVQDFITSSKYPMTPQGSFTAKDVDSFVESILEGKTKPFYISAPIPESNVGPVKTVVHDNFADLVLDDTKDVLIEMYTNWCNACKRLSSLYEQLGEAFLLGNSDKVTIGKMDLEANDQPTGINLKIETIPALFLFRAGKKSDPIRYHGDYSLDDLKKFVLENATNKLVPLPVVEDKAPQEDEDIVDAEHVEL